MPRKTTALLALLLFIALPTSAQALELGVQDDGRTSSAVTQDATAIGGSWTRAIAYIGQPGIAERIRDAHTAGKHVILTIGGIGTKSRRPSFTKALRYIDTLPRADKYTINNEVDIDGTKPCTYRRGWLKARRHLGSRLLFGDFSPINPVSYTMAVRKCGRLPKHLDVAIHPYQRDDPLRPSARSEWLQGCMGCLNHARRAFKGMGLRVTWWGTEFGFNTQWNTDAQAAWMWPRAVKQAKRQNMRVLIAYTAQGASWDTRPGPLAWCSMTRGHSCPSDGASVSHREPVRENEHHVRGLDPIRQDMLDYAKE